MTDITMCMGDECPVKQSCYRFRAVASTYQSMFAETPYKDETQSCEYFWYTGEPELKDDEKK